MRCMIAFRTIFRLGLLLCLFVFLLFSMGLGEEHPDTREQYIVLATVRTDTIKKQLAEASAQGYRIVAGDAANNFLLLKKGQVSDRSDYRYFDNLFRGMKEAAAEGYRLLPDTLGTREYVVGGVMEKVAGSPRYEYEILDTVKTSNFQKDLADAAAEGWKLVGLQSEVRHYGVLERLNGRGSPAEHMSDYLQLATKRPSTIQREIDDAASRGYRVVGATAAEEMIVVLEGPAEVTPARYEYQVLSVARSGTLEKEINAAAARGFRVLPNTMSLFKKKSMLSFPSSDELAVVMEKDLTDSRTHEYKLLGTRRVSTLAKELNETVAQGFEVAGTMLSYQEQLILLERTSSK